MSDAASSGYCESPASDQGKRGLEKKLNIMFLGREGALRPTLPGTSSCPCPFRFKGCPMEFHMDQVGDWYKHSLTHFHIPGKRPRNASPPTSCQCPFCEQMFSASTGAHCWKKRMEHVALHHHAGRSLSDARLDFTLVEYLWEKGLMDVVVYRDLKAKAALTPPASPGSGATLPNDTAFSVLHEATPARVKRM